jgi:methylase of polypeptide subunit release factors
MIKKDQQGKKLRQLVERLVLLGYAEYYTSLNPLFPRLSKWQKQQNNAPKYLRPIIDLFLLTRPVHRERLKDIMEDFIDPLRELGLLVQAGGYVQMLGLILVPMFGQWIFCQKPQIDPKIYFGDDTIALMLRLQPKKGGHCLDLCAGPGSQALYCSRLASKVTAIEINPVVAALAQLNVYLNQCEKSVEVYCGDLFQPVKGEIFDTIVANPPLLPFPKSISYPFVGHGGNDGMAITWRILNGLPSALAKDGIAQVIGTCLSDGDLPLCSEALSEWSKKKGFDILLTVTSHLPLSSGTSFFKGLVYTAAETTHIKLPYIQNVYRASLKSQGASHLCAFFLHITPGVGNFHIQDLTVKGKQNLWYV